MREWEPWQDKEYAESRLKIWRNPTDPPEKWDKYKYERLSRLPQLINGKTVLDVGCGCGHSHAILKPHVEEYLGVDCKAMIDICHRFFKEKYFTVGDAYDLSPFGLYDTVIAIQLLIHLPDLKPVKQLWAHTKKSLIITLRPPGRSNIKKTMKIKNLYLIGRKYSRQEIIDAINTLNEVKEVEIYLSKFTYGRIIYIKINRGKGFNIKFNNSIFNNSPLI